MPSLIELAEICAAVYKGGSSVGIEMQRQTVEWQLKKPWSSRGFFAAQYQDMPGSRNVLAFRGTDDLVDLLVDDLAIGAGGIPPQIDPACYATAEVKDRPLILTGHSLGGALAIIAAAKYDLPAVTFNAPGVTDSCVQSIATGGWDNGLRALIGAVQRCIANPRIINIRIEADPVSGYFTNGIGAALLTRNPFNTVVAGFQPGETMTLPSRSCGLDALCRHGIQTCIAEVRARGDAFDPIQL
jgi:hypothetical protein